MIETHFAHIHSLSGERKKDRDKDSFGTRGMRHRVNDIRGRMLLECPCCLI